MVDKWLIALLVLWSGCAHGQKTQCRNIRTMFNETTHGWKVESSPAETFAVSEAGLRMRLLPPTSYERLIHKATMLPYNSNIGRGPTLNSTTYMHYGRLSTSIKSSKVGGAITAVILISDSGDEIDFEVIGSEEHTAQTNYFWGNHPLYTINGGSHDIPGDNAFDAFHTYTIDWDPDRIIWAVDGKAIRTKHRNETCVDDVCKFPSTPARIQIGFWDGSFQFGTAQWSHGPIDWEKHTDEPITSYLKEITVECNPDYNEIVAELAEDQGTDTLTPTQPDEGLNSNSPTKWEPKPEDVQPPPSGAAATARYFSYFIPFSVAMSCIAVLIGLEY